MKLKIPGFQTLKDPPSYFIKASWRVEEDKNGDNWPIHNAKIRKKHIKKREKEHFLRERKLDKSEI